MTAEHAGDDDQRVRAALRRQQSLAGQIVDVFDLNDAEFGRLFGVSGPVASGWLSSDVPSQQRPKARVVVAIAGLLSHELKAGRLPAVVRQPASAFGGKTMLDMIAEDRHEEVLELTRVSFEFVQRG